MVRNMILGVTPARGASIEIPRKNIRPICGKPLIGWTIEAAQRASLLDRYVVSTEDEEVAEVAGALGAEILPRPVELAESFVPTIDVLKHVLSEIDADVVVLLQATSPIRELGLIDRCIRRFQETGADSLATGFYCKYKEYGSVDVSRQRQDRFFYDDGNIYVIRADILRNNDRFGVKRELVELDREQSIEIDEEFDFWLAEKVMAKRLNFPAC